MKDVTTSAAVEGEKRDTNGKLIFHTKDSTTQRRIGMKTTLKFSVLMLLVTTMLSGCIWWDHGGREGDRGGGRGGEFRGEHGGDHGGEHDERR